MSVAACPFPGLLPFDEKDAPFFFGRDEETAELLHRLQRNRFIAVIGVSGSGKSSLVGAGLKPELRISEPPWRMVEIKPGGGPRERLQRALESVLPSSGWDELLGKSSYGLVDGVAAGGLRAGEKLLVIVDQFEEIFSYRKRGDRETEEADLFVQQILRAGAEPGLPAYVMLTMRTDFLGHCALFRGLPEALNQGTYLVPRLTRHQQEEAITAPLAVSGVEIEPAVVDHLLNAAEANRDELPVLQHLLKRLWEEWASRGGSGRIDTLETERTGSWSKAIDLDAELVLRSLDAQAQNAVQLVFKRITEKGAGERPIRTPCSFDELTRLMAGVVTPEQLRDTLSRFRSRDLLTWTDEARAGDERIDIPHECVTWRWNRLERWIAEEEIDSRRLLFIGESARSGTPLAGSALSEALALRPRLVGPWATRYGLESSNLTRWIDHSHQEATRARQRTRRLMAGLAIATLVFAALGGWALQQRRAAEMNARVAVAEKANAEKQTARAMAAEDAAKDDAARAEDQKRVAEEQSAEAFRQKSIADERLALVERQRIIAEGALQRAEAADAALEQARLQLAAIEYRSTATTSPVLTPSPVPSASMTPDSTNGLLIESALIALDVSSENRGRYLPHLLPAMREFDITTPLRQAAFLAQMSHESGGFRFNVENLNYPALALRQVFGRYFPTDEAAQAFARQPEKIANRIYANRLGNGPEESGDGWRYRGRGILPITGRSNYAAYGDLLRLDLVADPDKVSEPDVSIRIAAAFWRQQRLNELADSEDLIGITRRINGGDNGLAHRRELYQKAKDALAARG